METLPEGFLDDGSETQSQFSLIVDGNTDDGKDGMASQLALDSSWEQAIYIKTGNAELQKTHEVGPLTLLHFQLSTLHFEYVGWDVSDKAMTKRRRDSSGLAKRWVD